MSPAHFTILTLKYAPKLPKIRYCASENLNDASIDKDYAPENLGGASKNQDNAPENLHYAPKTKITLLTT